MTIQESARRQVVSSRMAVTNRQRSLLGRAAANVGMSMDVIGAGSRIQCKPRYDAQHAYGRSNAAMS